jgi:hypothetical protein
MLSHKHLLRERLGYLIMYSMTITLSDCIKDYWDLGQRLFRMIGAIHGVAIKDADVDALKKRMMTMPAHADAAEGLKMLKDAGFRMVTLTNSPQVPGGKSPLENANLDKYFELQSVSRRHAPTSRHRSSTTWWSRSSTCPRKNAVWWRHMYVTRSARRARACRAAFSRGRAMPSCRSQASRNRTR